jgi:hypothetical protein
MTTLMSAVDSTSGTRRVVTASVDNATYSINESMVCHSTLDERTKLCKVIPSINIIPLDALDPIKHSCDPLELFVL